MQWFGFFNLLVIQQNMVFCIQKLKRLQCVIIIGIALLKSGLTSSSNECIFEEKCGCSVNPDNEIHADCNIMPMALNQKIKSVNLMGNFPVVTKMTIVGLFKVEWLNMTQCYVHYFEDAFVKVNSFKVLILSKNELETIDKDTFRYLNKLEELYLDKNKIKTVEEFSFKHLPNLKVLDISDNNLKEITFFETMPSLLSTLLLANNNISVIPTTVQNNLTILDLCGNQIPEVTELHKMRKLKNLCLSGVKYLPIDGLSPNITDLSLTGDKHNLTNLTYPFTITIGQMSNLSVLYLDSYVILSFDFFEELTKLRKLSLVSIQLHGGARVANIFKHKTSLESLNLTDSPLVASELLKSFNIIPSVKFLNLQQTGITSLKNFTSVKYLKTLDISKNPLNCLYDDIKWLENIKNVSLYLVNWQQLVCSEPREFKGLLLLDVLNYQLHLNSKDRVQPSEYINQMEEKNLDYNIFIYIGIVIIVAFLIVLFIVIRKFYVPRPTRLVESNSTMELSHSDRYEEHNTDIL